MCLRTFLHSLSTQFEQLVALATSGIGELQVDQLLPCPGSMAVESSFTLSGFQSNSL